MPAFVTRHKLRLVVRALIATLVFWAAVLTFNWHFGANYPESAERQQDALLVAWVIEFLLIKSLLLIAHTYRRDWLGWSLIAFNLAFALYWFAALEIFLFPDAFDYRALAWVLKLGIWATTTWGIVELVRIEDEPDDDGPRSDGLP